ncbi:GDSL-type esterase/lipase family protein [Streptomyces sp. NBC_01314]|uniref:GDSL-type esterase/lipase family protein n=1 Tax=Streptomyces sp. NBC_01314 TaxID=2903821 RepID=UPI00308EE1B4|nr:GDSL-type esterase/lipase family protein [Streptomyces sp. NBC_01314]
MADSSAAWIATHRSAVISPHKDFTLFELRGFADQTVRQPLRIAGGGEALRIRLSNRYGKEPLEIAGAHLARRTEASAIVPASDTVLRFAGADTVTIGVGDEVVSDPVEQKVSAGEELVLSLYLPHDTGLTTYSAVPYDIGYAAPGNQLTAASFTAAEELATGHFLTGIDVLAPEGTAIAVAFGDSWIEGFATTPGADNSFPAQLGRRLPHGWIVNQGISGNRLLTDGIGEHLLARLEHDVLDVPGVSHVLIHIGLNDLGVPGTQSFPEPPVLPALDDLIAGYTMLADRIHAAGLVAVAATLGPYEGTVYDGVDTPAGQALRHRINDWLLGPDQPFDAVLDIAAAVADPERPERIREEYNSGDGLHVNDAGAKAIADAVDLSLLRLGN